MYSILLTLTAKSLHIKCFKAQLFPQTHSTEQILRCLMCFFSFFWSVLRGLFASHYTETHYREDGSAVTGAHNFTVRWHSSAFDIYVQVDMLRCSRYAEKTDPDLCFLLKDQYFISFTTL